MQVREYARITTEVSAEPSLDCGVVSEATFDWLQDVAADWKASEPVALINDRRSLKLGSYVGYLQSPTGETIEILPKTGFGAEDPQLARVILQQMLVSALGIKPRETGSAELKGQHQPLHEWIFGQFLQELKWLVTRGLRFDYERVEEESRFLRGQLQVAQQMRQPPGRGHQFHICHDVFSPNRLENRLLKTALDQVQAVCQTSENWRLANELSHWMAEIPGVPNPVQRLPHWKSSKLTQEYDAVKPWCALILERFNPNFQRGIHQGVSLLFPMEQLFEKYVEASLRPRLMPGVRLYPQGNTHSGHLLMHAPDGAAELSPWFQLKPDILLHSSHGIQVLDAKWKLLDQTQAHRGQNQKYGIFQGDLYQLFAYGHKFQGGEGHMMLIFPRHAKFQKALPPFYFSDVLVIWAVPFCLESRQLIPGTWEENFPLIADVALTKTAFRGSDADYSD